MLLPGTKNVRSTMLLPMGENRRSALKVLKISGYVGLMLPKRTAVFAGLELSALTCTPAPGVLKKAPRELKKSPGRKYGAAKLSGTPSQLISRGGPRSARNR